MQYPLSPSHTKSEGFTLWPATGWRNCVRFPGRERTFLFSTTIPTSANLICKGYRPDRPQITVEVKKAWSFTSFLHISHGTHKFTMAPKSLIVQSLPTVEASRSHSHTTRRLHSLMQGHMLQIQILQHKEHSVSRMKTTRLVLII